MRWLRPGEEGVDLPTRGVLHLEPEPYHMNCECHLLGCPVNHELLSCRLPARVLMGPALGGALFNYCRPCSAGCTLPEYLPTKGTFFLFAGTGYRAP